jgi:uncharacterized protein (TIGR02996 family)
MRMPATDERAFFDRIRDAPDDDAPRLIYADWLDEHDQPDRAEFIRLQCALDRLPDDDPRRPELRERERLLSEANEDRWTASLRPLVSAWEFRRGVVDRVSVDAHQFLDAGTAIFDLAPVRKVRFVNVGEHLTELVQSPQLRLIRELDLAGNDLGNRGPNLLAKSRHLVRLDSLDLGFTELGDKGLQALAGSPVFSSLRRLQINDNNHLGVPGMRALSESQFLTSLVELDISGNSLSALALRPLFESPLAERLDRLALQRNRLGDAGMESLVVSPVFARMIAKDLALDLRRLEIGPMGAKALAASPAIERVESLDLEGNVLSDQGLAALAASPYLKRLRVLSLRENRIGDDGVLMLSRSSLMATLRVLDLTGNLITRDSQDRLHEASVAYDWRGLLQLKVDSELRSRPTGPLAGYFRRPLS